MEPWPLPAMPTRCSPSPSALSPRFLKFESFSILTLHGLETNQTNLIWENCCLLGVQAAVPRRGMPTVAGSMAQETIQEVEEMVLERFQPNLLRSLTDNVSALHILAQCTVSVVPFLLVAFAFG